MQWQNYSVIVLETRSWNQSFVQAPFPLDTLGESLPLPLPSSSGCWHSLTGSHIPPVSAPVSVFPSVCMWMCFFLIQMFIIGFKAYLGNPGWSYLKLLNIITCANTFFSKYSYSHMFWESGLGHFCWGTTVQPLQHSRSPPLSVFVTFLSWPCPLFSSSLFLLIQQCEYPQSSVLVQRGRSAFRVEVASLGAQHRSRPHCAGSLVRAANEDVRAMAKCF